MIVVAFVAISLAVAIEWARRAAMTQRINQARAELQRAQARAKKALAEAESVIAEAMEVKRTLRRENEQKNGNEKHAVSRNRR